MRQIKGCKRRDYKEEEKRWTFAQNKDDKDRQNEEKKVIYMDYTSLPLCHHIA